ncbi:uncharacterized protein LOC115679437 [Syzygium oleosum]|uniref:uncharacterized protein LOC115679437 n=1 Tax=Syzygium oleosum TaxID=219896 RepID=UPI0011D253C6|nr:uncharacterized protein LOC115679437 [Syzygium oleosum]
MGVDFFGWVPLVINKCFPWLMDLWEDWSIQLLVLTGLVFQITLAIFGGRRRYMTGLPIRFVVWSSYLLATYVAALALGKLTVIRVDDPEKPEYDTELKALLAPLLLMQLGNPDSITAYSVEDNRLGIRQVLNFVFSVAFVLWILIRCWETSAAASLYFPIFVAGMIKYGETIWALKSVYSENMSITSEDIDEEKNIPNLIQKLPTNIPDLDIFVKAYYRFDTLKPHLENWLYHPMFMSRHWMSIEEYNVENAYLTTAIELGFMYDVLYTKGPVLYTKLGITLRFISFFSLVSTLSGFAGIFQNSFLLDMYVAYTYALLIGVIVLEIYQILALPYSDWAIVKMVEHHRKPLVKTFLLFLVKMSMKKQRSSDMIGQFNMLDYCLHDKWLKFIKIPQFVGQEEQFKRYLKSTSKAIDTDLKELLLKGMKDLEGKRCLKPFTSRGQWTLELHNSLEELKWSIETAFDRSIITWHMATDICYHSNFQDSKNCSGSKLLSDYMMYLLAIRSYVLSLPTNEITFEHAHSRVKKFLAVSNLSNRDTALKKLSTECVQETDPEPGTGPIIFKKWHVLEEAQRLAGLLNNKNDPWKLISSVWVEMVCYTAYNCLIYNHTKLLRRGGDILTHVWLLLAHKTDKFNSMKLITQET